jgi:2-polyprenyl-3-methyl-5-hydroxy-6-metoxy-1,4-benzoquinol methylase
MSRSDSQVLEKTVAASNELADDSANRAVGCPLCGSSEISHFLNAPDRFHWRPQIFELLRCSACSCVWLNNPPQPHEMGPHYDEDYHKAIMMAGETAPAIRWKRHKELISRYKRGGTLLDIGCSSGAFLSTMKNPAWQLYGIEMEATTAEKAHAATGAEVFVGDVDDAPFSPDSFDVITAFDLLEHVYRPKQFLRNVLSWLKPGGIFVAMLPNIDSWESKMFGSYWFGLEMPRHLTHFSPRSLRTVLTKLGFQEVMLSTSTTYVERSMGYVASRIVEKAGGTPVPASKAEPSGFAFRAARKLVRVGLVQPFGKIASLGGAAANIEAVFTKPTASR